MLTMLTPNITLLQEWRQNSHKLACSKRSYTKFEENCDATLFDWPKSKRVVVSVFLPWMVAAKSLGELHHLGCWLSKHANRTSKALSDLLKDEETTRHATLQNRATTDFLLLVHGHGCQDFEGLCCFNLFNHSVSISWRMQLLKQDIKDLKTKKDPEWFKNLFRYPGLKGWIASVLKHLLWVVTVTVLLTFSYLLRSLKRLGAKVFL